MQYKEHGKKSRYDCLADELCYNGKVYMVFTLGVAHLGVFPVKVPHGEALGLMAAGGHVEGDAEGLSGLCASLTIAKRPDATSKSWS